MSKVSRFHYPYYVNRNKGEDITVKIIALPYSTRFNVNINQFIFTVPELKLQTLHYV